MPANCPTCQHTRANGNRCGSPALRGEYFCFYHHPTRRPPARARNTRPPFRVPALIDNQSLQIALSEICYRLAGNTLDIRRARLLLQMAKTNLAATNSASAGSDLPDMSQLMQLLSLQPTPAASEL